MSGARGAEDPYLTCVSGEVGRTILGAWRHQLFFFSSTGEEEVVSRDV